MSAHVINCSAVSMPLADESVNLIVMSPPYFALRSYQDGGEHLDGQIGAEPTPQAFLESLWLVMAECWRVLTPDGSVFVNLGDKYAGSGGHNNAGTSGSMKGSNLQGGKKHMLAKRAADRATRRNAPDSYNKASGSVRRKSLLGLPSRFANGCVDGLAGPCERDHEHVGRHPAYLPHERCEGERWIKRADIIWNKRNAIPDATKDRVQRRHEDWFHFTKSERYFADLDSLREPSDPKNLRKADIEGAPSDRDQRKRSLGHAEVGHVGRPLEFHPLGKVPGSVWAVSSEPLRVPEYLGIDHFAAFPTEFPRRFVEGWSPRDGVVLDPFGGTGTTAMVAKALGRTGVSVDLSADYCRLAEWRTNDATQLARVRSRSARNLQGGLFDAPVVECS